MPAKKEQQQTREDRIRYGLEPVEWVRFRSINGESYPALVFGRNADGTRDLRIDFRPIYGGAKVFASMRERGFGPQNPPEFKADDFERGYGLLEGVTPSSDGLPRSRCWHRPQSDEPKISR